MIKGIGNDIIEIERVQKAIERTDSFKNNIFTDNEIIYAETIYVKEDINRDGVTGLTDIRGINSKLLKTIDGEYKFDDYITLLPVNGHTRFMSLVKISDEKETLLYTADLIPMESHLPLPYIMGYDLFPLITLEEKRKYLTEASEKNWTLFLEHDPYAECIKPGFEKERFFTKEKFTL